MKENSGRLLLNFARFFLGVAATSLGTLVTAPPNQDRVFYSFLNIFILTLMAGIVLLSVWYVMHRSVASLIVEIKAQMPPNPPVEQGPSEPPDTGEGRPRTRRCRCQFYYSRANVGSTQGNFSPRSRARPSLHRHPSP